MIRNALQGYSQIELTLFAMLLFIVVFTMIMIHTFSKSQKKIYDQLQLFPLSENPAGNFKNEVNHHG